MEVSSLHPPARARSFVALEFRCAHSNKGYNPQPPQTTASPGPGKGRVNRGPPGPSTPHQAPSSSYPDARPSPQLGRPPSPLPPHQGHQIINNLADLDVGDLSPQHRRDGSDWFAIFNPRIPRVLDVDLKHTLNHDSVVCCVRFSQDGRHVATGCNRSAQIFDVANGQQVTKLQDESVDKDGDLYIRSVCFSPDGKYLATGAEDKQIRVRWPQCSFRIGLTECLGLGYCFPHHSKYILRA